VGLHSAAVDSNGKSVGWGTSPQHQYFSIPRSKSIGGILGGGNSDGGGMEHQTQV